MKIEIGFEEQVRNHFYGFRKRAKPLALLMVKLRVSPLVKLMVLTLRVTPSATRRALAKEQSHWLCSWCN